MKKNMGSTDKIIRSFIAVVIAVLYFTGTISGNLGLILLILGGVFLATSFISYCPLYAPFGISTCKKNK
jgi:glucokinase